MKRLAKLSKLLKMLRYQDLKKTGMTYEQRLGFSDNQWQNTSQKVKISGKTRQGQTTFISAFA